MARTMQRQYGWIGLLVGLVLLGFLGCGPKPSPEVAAPAPTSSAVAAPVPAPAPPPIPTTLRLVTGIWAPYADAVGKPRFATDLVERALERSGIQVESTLVDHPTVLPAITSGEFDGTEAVWKTPEREKELLYSDPFLENRLVLLARVGTDVSADQLADLQGKKVGLVEDYAYGPELDAAKGVTFVRGTGEPANLEALLKKELDYILLDELTVYHVFTTQKAKAEALLVSGKNALITRGLHFALERGLPGAEEVMKRFNAAIRELARDGTYNTVLSVGWIATDTDQDGHTELVASSKQVGTAPPERHYRLYGSENKSGPKFVVEGRAYENWQSVPEQYKVPPKEGLDRFQPAAGLVLMEF